MWQSLPRTEYIGPGRTRLLLEPLVWDDGEFRFTIPAGFRTDFYSWFSVGKVFIPDTVEQIAHAIGHDYLFVTQQLSLWDTDSFLARAMKAGVKAPDGGVVPGSVVPWHKRRVVMVLRLGSWRPWNHNKRQREEGLAVFMLSHGLMPDGSGIPGFVPPCRLTYPPLIDQIDV